MENFDITLSLNASNIPVTVHTYEANEKTYYDIPFENYTLTIYKDTLYTWASDDSNGLNKADIQSIGEQIDNV